MILEIVQSDYPELGKIMENGDEIVYTDSKKVMHPIPRELLEKIKELKNKLKEQ